MTDTSRTSHHHDGVGVSIQPSAAGPDPSGLYDGSRYQVSVISTDISHFVDVG